MSVEYECTLGLPKDKAMDFIDHMNKSYHDWTDAPYVVFYLTDEHFIVKIAGNHANQSGDWLEMLSWCRDNLMDDEYDDEPLYEYDELCTEWSACGNIICTMTVPAALKYTEYMKLDDVINALTKPLNNKGM